MPRIASKKISELRASAELIVLSGALFVLTGCGEPQHKVVAAWRGDFTGEGRTNVKTILGPPVLEAVTPAEEPGFVQIQATQKQYASFNVEKRYQKVGAVRHLSVEQVKQSRDDSVKTALVGVFLAGMWTVPPAGASLTAGAAAIESKNTQKAKQAENSAIQQLKDGKSSVTVPVDHLWSTSQTDYKRQIVGEETEPAGAGSEEQMVPAGRLPLKVENLAGCMSPKKALTDNSGTASVSFAGTLAQAAALKPAQWKISAKWAGRWRELGTVRLTQEWIAQAVTNFREQSLRATGKPELPPEASLSFKVSDGFLRAGAAADLSLAVVNAGLGEFYRLEVITESDVPALDGLKFEFGKLAPGEGLALLRTVHIPSQQPHGQAVVRFRWSELNGFAPAPVEAAIPIYNSHNF